MLVRNCMTKRPITVGPEEPLAAARALLDTHTIRQLPVVSDETLVGIVTDRDLRSARAKARRVGDVMTAKVQVIAPEMFVDEAARRLRRRRIGALPVVDNGRLVGILTTADVLDAFVDLSGVREATTQLVVGNARGSNASEQVREIVRKVRGEVKWLHRDTKNPGRLLVRLKVAQVDDVAYALEAAGFTVDAVINSSRTVSR